MQLSAWLGSGSVLPMIDVIDNLVACSGGTQHSIRVAQVLFLAARACGATRRRLNFSAGSLHKELESYGLWHPRVWWTGGASETPEQRYL